MPTTAQGAEDLVRTYYAAFNAHDRVSMLALLTEDVVHDPSQGGRRVGRDAFAEFMAHMDACYREHIDDIMVLTEPSGARAAAEFTVRGTYVATEPGVPEGTAPARGQTYVLPAGAFFTLRGERIARVSNHYNLGDWVAQVSVP